VTKSKSDIDDPSAAKPQTERAEPKVAKLRIESVSAFFAGAMESEEPIRAKLRSDSVEPILAKSKTDKAELSRTKLRSDIDEPRRRKSNIDTALP